MLLFDGRRQHDDLARAARRQRKAVLSRAHVCQRAEVPREAARLRPATVRDAIHRRASPGRRARAACSSARLRARLRPARGRARTIPGASRARPPCRRHARHGGTHRRRAPSTPTALRHPRAGGAAPRHARSGAPRACSGRGMRFRPPPSAQGCPLARAARSARTSAARAAFVRSRRIAIPATTSSWATLHAGGSGAGSKLGDHTLGFVEAADQEQAPEPRGSAHGRHLRGRRGLRASPAPR